MASSNSAAAAAALKGASLAFAQQRQKERDQQARERELKEVHERVPRSRAPSTSPARSVSAATHSRSSSLAKVPASMAPASMPMPMPTPLRPHDSGRSTVSSVSNSALLAATAAAVRDHSVPRTVPSLAPATTSSLLARSPSPQRAASVASVASMASARSLVSHSPSRPGYNNSSGSNLGPSGMPASRSASFLAATRAASQAASHTASPRLTPAPTAALTAAKTAKTATPLTPAKTATPAMPPASSLISMFEEPSTQPTAKPRRRKAKPASTAGETDRERPARPLKAFTPPRSVSPRKETGAVDVEDVEPRLRAAGAVPSPPESRVAESEKTEKADVETRTKPKTPKPVPVPKTLHGKRDAKDVPAQGAKDKAQPAAVEPPTSSTPAKPGRLPSTGSSRTSVLPRPPPSPHPSRPRTRDSSSATASVATAFSAANRAHSSSSSVPRSTSTSMSTTSRRTATTSVSAATAPTPPTPPPPRRSAGPSSTHTVDGLANAIVAGSLAAAAAAATASKAPPVAPAAPSHHPHLPHVHLPHLPHLHPHHSGPALHTQAHTQTQAQLPRPPSPPRRATTMLQTLRRDRSPSARDYYDEDELFESHYRRSHYHRDGRLRQGKLRFGHATGTAARHKHQHHHEGARKRWREAVTERQRRRYEAVWASNRGDRGFKNVAVDASPDTVPNIVVRDIWRRSRLPTDELEEVWDLVDADATGALDKTAFVVGLWLIDQRLRGRKIPARVSESVWASARCMQLKR